MIFDQLLLRWTVAASFLLVACTQQKEPGLDQYYLRLTDLMLVVPAAYVAGDLEITHRKNAGAVSSQAVGPPGWPVAALKMLLHPTDLRALTIADVAAMRPVDDVEVRIFAHRPSPRSEASLVSGLKRSPQLDEAGLAAYLEDRVSAAEPLRDRHYLLRSRQGSHLVHCSGFGLPRPMCRVTGSWQGVGFEYSFSHRHLDRTMALHEALFALLNSFVAAPKS